ncbi:hypothetical protein [Truepera radiovictrix]|uniref:Uncharacterized protein n=1 Tax=Truepera radiovictrix (strain DSM 17093 / CIP 108686 / LMG 22925 / RQ-24) TaxID=649638 RepID=D7CTS4_TRURR|nr:hypothetical protein [Truepera radiovictrix]ADI15621.1 hypothetical protein Trad_2514 [Truepera radiovictrix DSM 17093]WMT58749.1 hypothetical protein RCV51_07330 [Truepera radiovictrix]
MAQILQDHPPQGASSTQPQDYPHYLSQLGAIHALRDELELTPQQYRRLLQRLTGSTSAKYMTPEERERLIAFLVLHRDLSDLAARTQAALEHLNASFGLVGGEVAMAKEVYLNGDFLTRTQASLESIIAMMRTRYGDDARLVCASEEREVDETSLKLEFVA